MKRLKLKSIDFILAYAENKDMTNYYTTCNNTEIRFYQTWNKLKRVFNNGHGLLELAAKYDDILLLNDILISKSERKKIGS